MGASIGTFRRNNFRVDVPHIPTISKSQFTNGLYHFVCCAWSCFRRNGLHKKVIKAACDVRDIVRCVVLLSDSYDVFRGRFDVVVAVLVVRGYMPKNPPNPAPTLDFPLKT